MFMSMLIHEVACSLVVWYSKGTCDGPERGGIKKEGGQYVEERLWESQMLSSPRNPVMKW